MEQGSASQNSLCSFLMESDAFLTVSQSTPITINKCASSHPELTINKYDRVTKNTMEEYA